MLFGPQLGVAVDAAPDTVGIEDSDAETDSEPEDGPDEEDDELTRGPDAGPVAAPVFGYGAGYGAAGTGAPRDGVPGRIFRPPIA